MAGETVQELGQRHEDIEAEYDPEHAPDTSRAMLR
jgi:hypothetical protein